MHFGKPKSSLLTFPINFLIKIIRKKTPIDSELRSSLKNKKRSKSLIFILRQLVLAFDRFRLAKIIWDKSSRGNIILCDRYKTEDYGFMDSKRLIPKDYIGLKKTLSLKENYLYDSMSIPDILFYLTVPVDIAVQRNESRVKKGKESEVFLRLRHSENQNLRFKAKNVYKINTDRVFKDVIIEIKELIWKNI